MARPTGAAWQWGRGHRPASCRAGRAGPTGSPPPRGPGPDGADRAALPTNGPDAPVEESAGGLGAEPDDGLAPGPAAGRGAVRGAVGVRRAGPAGGRRGAGGLLLTVAGGRPDIERVV